MRIKQMIKFLISCTVQFVLTLLAVITVVTSVFRQFVNIALTIHHRYNPIPNILALETTENILNETELFEIIMSKTFGFF